MDNESWPLRQMGDWFWINWGSRRVKLCSRVLTGEAARSPLCWWAGKRPWWWWWWRWSWFSLWPHSRSYWSLCCVWWCWSSKGSRAKVSSRMPSSCVDVPQSCSTCCANRGCVYAANRRHSFPSADRIPSALQQLQLFFRRGNCTKLYFSTCRGTSGGGVVGRKCLRISMKTDILEADVWLWKWLANACVCVCVCVCVRVCVCVWFFRYYEF